MSSIQEYFHTDWAQLTVHDWIGLILTVVVFFLMIAAYVLVFHPKNRDKLESQRHIPFEDDRLNTEDKK